jgi:hypothetical protein
LRTPCSPSATSNKRAASRHLSLYEQRLNRTLEKSLKQLQTLQAERRAQTEAAARQAEKDREERARLEQTRLEQARLEKERETPRNLHEIKPKQANSAKEPAAREFVFSTSEIESQSPHKPAAEGAQTTGIYGPAATRGPNFFEKRAA